MFKVIKWPPQMHCKQCGEPTIEDGLCHECTGSYVVFCSHCKRVVKPVHCTGSYDGVWMVPYHKHYHKHGESRCPGSGSAAALAN